MKRICFVTTVYLTYQCFLKQFSEYLFQTGEYDVSLICDPEEKISQDLPEFVHYYPVKMERGISLSGFAAMRKIKRILKREKFDVVQFSTPNAAFYTALAAKAAGVPVRLYCQWGIRYMGFEGVRRTIFKLLEKITCRFSTFIEVESHCLRSFALAEKLYKSEKSCVIWNGSASGVDLQKFDHSQKEIWRKELRGRFGFDEKTTVFSFAGRLTADKGINELLEAFLSLPSDPSAALLVMGGEDDESALNLDLFERAKKDGRVFFAGSVQDLERYYAASDVFVAPSYREGFGLVVIEAGAMGLPAVVSDVPGQLDAVEKDVTGLVCRVKDSASLREKMELFLSDGQKRREMGRAAHEYVESHYEQRQLFIYLKEHRDQLIGESLCRK